MVKGFRNGSLISNGTQICIKPTDGHQNGHNTIGNGYTSQNGNCNGKGHIITEPEIDVKDNCGVHECIVVLCSAIINGTIFGVVNSFGVLYVHLITQIKKNGESQKEFLEPLIAGIGSLCVGLIFFCSIFASILTDRFGVRRICFWGGFLAAVGMYLSSLSTKIFHLYITYGVILGIGASLAYTPSLVILGHYFKRRLGLANGLVTAGSSLFTVIMPIVLNKTIEAHGIQTTLAYLSALMALLMICALPFTEKSSKRGSDRSTINSNTMTGSKSINSENSEKEKKIFFNRALLHNKLYLLWAIAIPVALFGYFVPFVHLVKHASDILPEEDAHGEIFVMCIGLFSGIGRFIIGPIADFSNINRIIIQQISFVSIGILTMMLTVANKFAYLLVICCGLGIFDGCFISLLGPIAFDLVGPTDASQAIGLLLCFCSLPLTIGPPVAAYLYDIYGNYTMAFIIAGIPPLIGSLVMLHILRIQKKFGHCVSVNEDNHHVLKPSIFATESNHFEDSQKKSLVNDKV